MGQDFQVFTLGRTANHKVNKLGVLRGFDLILADLLEGLVVLIITSPPIAIPIWNAHHLKDVGALFEFVDTNHTDDAPRIVVSSRIYDSAR